MTFEQLRRSSFFPSTERAPHRTTTGIPCGWWSFALTLSLALPNYLSPFGAYLLYSFVYNDLYAFMHSLVQLREGL